jgi:hypothetical protein
MRYILIILVFLSVGANAQMVIKAHANYRPLVQPATNLLLDDFTGGMVAYSLRKLDKDYTGSAIRVRKDTTGQPEKDIGFLASGELDTADLKDFCKTRSCFVTTWYNQADSSGTFGVRNGTQTSSVPQPRIVSNGVVDRQGNKPTLVFDGDDRFVISPFTYSAEFSLYQINKKNTTGNIAVNLTATGGNVPGVINHWLDGVIYFGYRRSGANYYRTVNFNNANFNLLEGYARSDARSLYANNTLQTLGSEISMTGVVTQYNSIGSYSGFIATGRCSEIILFNTDHSASRSTIVSNINTFYSIY